MFRLCVLKEESFPISLKYVDVTRTTHTNLTVMQEKRINDYWNDDGDRTLSDSWTGFTKFKLLNENPPPGNMWSRERSGQELMKMTGVGISFASQTKPRTHLLIG